jgi:hypothetical protein
MHAGAWVSKEVQVCIHPMHSMDAQLAEGQMSHTWMSLHLKQRWWWQQQHQPGSCCVPPLSPSPVNTHETG